ncbi:hypothetical protein [Candidatus Uabimicrobium sp. HlEnr_7]|uniref:hypothetical protein n=1 Tax=Candidatus Uabimicrobium helgolandensis TaxID=3095367 RepID=UPI003557EB31
MKNRILLSFFVICLGGCCHIPNFGNATTRIDTPQWFANDSLQYTVKHITNITFDNNENNEIDLIGYLMVKKNDFRLLGMSEIGITLFDLYDEANKPLVTVKSFAELEKYDVLQNIAADIRLLFLSQQMIKNDSQVFIDKDNNTTYLRASDTWIAWKIDAQNKSRNITVGKCSTILKEINYELNDKPFFEKAFIHYPRMGIKIEIEVLEVEPRTISNKKFIPREISP